jgi:hypothetical protein
LLGGALFEHVTIVRATSRSFSPLRSARKSFAPRAPTCSGSTLFVRLRRSVRPSRDCGLSNASEVAAPVPYSYGPSSLWPIPVSGSTGLRFDAKGVDWYYSAGLAAGPELIFGAAVSSGNLSHRQELTVSRNFKYAFVAGMGMSQEGTFDPDKPLSVSKNQSTSFSVLGGWGISASQDYTKSYPLITTGSLTAKPVPVQTSYMTYVQSAPQARQASYQQLASRYNALKATLNAYIKSTSKSPQ